MLLYSTLARALLYLISKFRQKSGDTGYLCDDDKNFREEFRAKDVATRLYGRLAVYNKTPITKFTIAVNDEKIFNYMINYPPIHLNIKISIMLVDLDEGKYTDYEF